MTTLYCRKAEGADYHPVKAAFQPTAEEMICPDHGIRMSTFKPRRASLTTASTGKPKKRKALKQGKGFAVATAQRAAVKGKPCVVCGSEHGVDPAHLYPRSLSGGCDCKEGVIPLCRRCHGLYDDASTRARVRLLERLMTREYFAEIAHPIAAHGVSPLTLLQHVTGQKWEAQS